MIGLQREGEPNRNSSTQMDKDLFKQVCSEQCQTLRTKTLRWHQSHQRRTCQMANFRSSEAGTHAGFYLWRYGCSVSGRLQARGTINTSTWRKEVSCGLIQAWHQACFPIPSFSQGAQTGEQHKCHSSNGSTESSLSSRRQSPHPVPTVTRSDSEVMLKQRRAAKKEKQRCTKQRRPC